MNLQQLIEQAKQEVAESLASEKEDSRLDVKELAYILSQFKHWKKWYLKKNQPLNYFRVTCIVPPGMEERPYFWICKFQVWVKQSIEFEYRITAEAYRFFTEQEDWKQSNSYTPTHYVYNPQI